MSKLMKTVGMMVVIAGMAQAQQPAGKTQYVPGRFSIERLKVIEGLNIPECVCIDSEGGRFYVSNIVAPKHVQQAVNAKDGKGFITRLLPDGTVESLRWVDSTPAAPLHSIKGMCVLEGVLYGADLTQVVRYRLQTAEPLSAIPIPGSRMLNDMATDGRSVYVSDTKLGKVFRICVGAGEVPLGRPSRGSSVKADPPQRQALPQIQVLPAPEGVNGITFFEGKMYAVSVTKHDIFQMDPEGHREPKPFGLAEHFTGLDGIEALDDGSFLVSDVRGHKLFHVAADKKTVRLLAELPWPADIGLDRKRGLLMVPLFWDSQVVVYKLKRELP